MNYKPWTLALVSVGLVSLPAVTNAEENKTTPASVLTALSSTTLSGYVDTSAHWNIGTGNASLPAIGPNGASGTSKADGFNLNVVAITLSHPPGEGDWAAGYNATLLYGADAKGYNNTVGSATSDFSLKDAYVELKAPVGNGLDFKIGTFAQPLGYEVYETGNNPNYTRSYGYEIEPTSLTGIMLAYTFCPCLSANAGIANVWSPGVNNRANPFGIAGLPAESYKAYFGSLTFTAPKDTGFLEGSTLSMGFVNGFDTGVLGEKTSLYIGGAMKTPVKCLTVGWAYDYVMLDKNATGNTSAYQSAVGGYLILQATDKLSFNTRFEYMAQSHNAALVAASGLSTRQATEFTETIAYQLWNNVMTRLEFRWDHDCTSNDSYGGGGGHGMEDNALLIAANILYKF
jgi:hypothetical protein